MLTNNNKRCKDSMDNFVSKYIQGRQGANTKPRSSNRLIHVLENNYDIGHDADITAYYHQPSLFQILDLLILTGACHISDEVSQEIMKLNVRFVPVK